MRTLGQTSLQATGLPLTFICNYRKVNSSGSDYFIFNYNFVLVTGPLYFYNLKVVSETFISFPRPKIAIIINDM